MELDFDPLLCVNNQSSIFLHTYIKTKTYSSSESDENFITAT